MAEGGEASSGAPPARKKTRRKGKAGRKSEMSHNQRDDELSREKKGV